MRTLPLAAAAAVLLLVLPAAAAASLRGLLQQAQCDPTKPVPMPKVVQTKVRDSNKDYTDITLTYTWELPTPTAKIGCVSWIEYQAYATVERKLKIAPADGAWKRAGPTWDANFDCWKVMMFVRSAYDDGSGKITYSKVVTKTVIDAGWCVCNWYFGDAAVVGAAVGC